ncbi:MAG: hypothetical protein BHK79_00490 [Halanaerobium sp. MDAL1]|nr:MAG: hypothetical protein BHK79_00490 [Halanaerobium sp. MDAL1]
MKMDNKLFTITCSKHLQDRGKLNVALTKDKHYGCPKENFINFDNDTDLDKNSITILSYLGSNPKKDNFEFTAIQNNPYRYSTKGLLEFAKEKYDNIKNAKENFVYANGEIYLDVENNERIPKPYIKTVAKRIKEAELEVL